MGSSHPVRQTNIPLHLTDFIGRQQEVAEISHLLTSRRLLTLTGAGGIGKTRLASQVAITMNAAFPEGVWLVELAELTDPALVPQAVINALGIRETPGHELVELLTDSLANHHMLLLLDNCEHLLEACAHLAAALLQACPRLYLLVTSREALGLPGEIVRPVLPLALPVPDTLPNPTVLPQVESIRLFVDRARMRVPDFELTEANCASVAHICHLVDGIPLAIELAAARVAVLDTTQIAARLDDNLRLLAAAPRLARPRHQTMRAAIDWSYTLLSAAEQALWRRLSIFRGSFSLAAAEVVCAAADNPQPDALNPDFLDLLAQLVNKSLVIAVDGEQERRYRLLEPLRQYAAEQLDSAGETTRFHTLHRDWYLAWVESHQPGLFGAQQSITLQKFDLEYSNLRAALAWDRDELRRGLMTGRGAKRSHLPPPAHPSSGIPARRGIIGRMFSHDHKG